MTRPHEGKLHGVPETYNWASGPRIGTADNPKRFSALVAWGQLYEAAEGNSARNTRVLLRDIRTYYLSKRTGRWVALDYSREVSGDAYAEDFENNVNRPADKRRELTGGTSVTAGGGYNFHFWPVKGRSSIDPGDIKGVFTTVRAKLIRDDPDAPDDRYRARYLLGMGADFWLSKTAPWDDFKTNYDAGIGRHKYVTKNWRAFNMTTVSPEELRANPPPTE